MERQNVEILLEGLSKEWRKKAIKAAKKVGHVREVKDRTKKNSSHLYFGDGKYWGYDFEDDVFKTLTLPRDWNKFLRCIGADEEPKEGGVWVMVRNDNNYKFNTVIFRVKDNIVLGNNKIRVHSGLCFKGEFFTSEIGYNEGAIFYKSTPEEVAKLEAAERENGYFWNGKELVKVPEYVEKIGENKYSLWHNGMNGIIFKVIKMHEDGDCFIVKYEDNEARYLLRFEDCKPSTKEAYEAQEAKKTNTEGAYWEKSSNAWKDKYFKQIVETNKAREETGHWQKKYYDAKEKVMALLNEFHIQINENYEA